MYKIVVRNIIWVQNVKVTFIEKSGNDTKGDYTKFRFKFVADMVCWLFNNSRNGFESFSVVKID